MSAKGIVFDIKEFAVFDGPGIRTTVFFKGCPLRCKWCHNPEGFSFSPQLLVSYNSCSHCGKCEAVCPSPENCVSCGRCVSICPLGLRHISGVEYSAEELAAKLLKDANYLRLADGGYTVSGGEPTAQPEFLLELLRRLRGSHRTMETSGFCNGEIFQTMLDETELIMMDLKLVDAELHRRFTGQDNAPVLENLTRLRKSGKPFIIRIPLIPGVNDTRENLQTTADLLLDSGSLLKVEILPYHKTAGAKYGMVSVKYDPDFDAEREPNTDIQIFTGRGIPCAVL
ncbi:MAG: glycyl-radical enzyme activating protein [Treponema sp.]|jgi:pyruvate formate lyase activating enzyme|nr:glycyl-radical enzyme activating protein [Treponema sp.]